MSDPLERYHATEYHRRNMQVARVCGAQAAVDQALERALSVKSIPVWMVAYLESAASRLPGLQHDLAAWRDLAPDAPAHIKPAPHLAASQPADPVTNAGCRQPVKVNPLVWSAPPNGSADRSVCYSYGLFGLGYEVFKDAARFKLLGPDGRIGGAIRSLDAAKAAAQADYDARILAALEPAPHVNEAPKSEHDRADVLTDLPAAVAPSLRITGPNSDGEYWLHITAGGRSGGVNLGGEHGPICKRLLDEASETGAKE